MAGEGLQEPAAAEVEAEQKVGERRQHLDRRRGHGIGTGGRAGRQPGEVVQLTTSIPKTAQPRSTSSTRTRSADGTGSMVCDGMRYSLRSASIGSTLAAPR